MSKFNTTDAKAPSVNQSRQTVNKAGGQAYTQSAKLELASLALTSLLEDKFYESKGEQLKRLHELCDKTEPSFIAKLAIYARKTFGVRSITHVLACYIANNVKGQGWTKRFIQGVIHRPDDVLEILSYQITQHGRKAIPNSLKKGLGSALSTLSEYSLAKYAKSNANLSMVDAVNLLHPKHTEALGKLMKGTLEAPDTWEKSLTQVGQKAENEEDLANLKKGEWARLVNEKKLGYMALLRNLRNILQNAPEAIDEACRQLVNKEAISKSLVFPFRFMSALNEIESESGSTKLIAALSDAADLSLDNVPQYEGETLVALDVSGSMTTVTYSGRPKMTPAQIGAMFAAAFVKRNAADFMVFDTVAQYHSVNIRDSLFGIVGKMKFPGGGTNFPAIFQVINKKYDRIIILSDMQGWMYDLDLQTCFSAYKTSYNCKPRLYSFDLQGYGTLQFPQQDVFCVAGFSDKIFKVMGFLEQDRDALVNEIEKVDL